MGKPVPRPSHRVYRLSLFEGDVVNRTLAHFGPLSRRRRGHVIYRSLLLFAVTWLPTAILAVSNGYTGTELSGSNFFADFAAYAQFVVGLPLFVVAEAIVDRATHDAGMDFSDTGVIFERDLPRLNTLHRRIDRLQRSWVGDAVCAVLGFVLSGFIILTELRHPGVTPTWHSGPCGSLRCPTAPGWWEFVVALPILNFWWLRIAWKSLLWTEYLRAVSRLRLDVVATHPDRVGGIGFVSKVQGHFAWVLFAYGISNVAATVGYEMAIEGVDLWIPPVWGPVLGFVIVGPSLFLAPLLMFTRQLRRTKRRALRLYRERVMEQVRLYESEVLPRPAAERADVASLVDVQAMNQFSQLFERVESMRVVPFDFRSMGQLFASTLGTVASILPAQHVGASLSGTLGYIVKIVDFFFTKVGHH
jgi:hypothetical protein